MRSTGQETTAIEDRTRVCPLLKGGPVLTTQCQRETLASSQAAEKGQQVFDSDLCCASGGGGS